MKKKDIIICDKCGEKIAKYKCDLCGKDLCSDYTCSKGVDLKAERSRGGSAGYFNKIYLCEGCEKKFFDLLVKNAKETLDEDNKIKKIIIERVKKNLMLENLKENGN